MTSKNVARPEDAARSGVRAAIAISLLTAGVFVSAQQTSQRPVFRGGANFVTVDVYPRERGRTLEGLAAEDFQIFEDGKPQQVETFEFIRFPSHSADADLRDPNTVEESERLAADPHYRLFVLYLDTYHTTVVGSHEVRRPIVEFLNRTIGPSDLFGVTTPDQAPERLTFARRAETIEHELTRYWTWGSKESVIPGGLDEVRLNSPAEEKLWACYITRHPPEISRPLVNRIVRLWRRDLLFGHLEGLMARLRGIRDERKNLLLLTEGWVPRGPDKTLAEHAWNAKPTVGVTRSGTLRLGAVQEGTIDKAACDAELLRLADIDFEKRFRDLLTEANRANVSVYPVDLAGLRAAPTAGAMQFDVNVVSTLRTLAENTDGTAVVNRNDLERGLTEIADGLSSYYLLGYYSTNTNFDGRFRRIEVRLKRPGVSVSARRGYLAPTATMFKASETRSGTSPEDRPPVEAALGKLARSRSSADVLSYAAVRQGEVALVLELGSALVGITPWTAGADIQVTLASGDQPIGTVAGRLEPGARSVLLRLPIASASAESWRATVRMTSGRETLTDRVDVSISSSRLVGEALIFRATPSPSSPLRPVADFQYRRTERVHIEWPRLVTLDRREARLLGRNGQPLAVPVAVSERETDGRAVVAADLNLAPLSAGEYVIELMVGSGSETERRLLAIRVTQ